MTAARPPSNRAGPRQSPPSRSPLRNRMNRAAAEKPDTHPLARSMARRTGPSRAWSTDAPGGPDEAMQEDDLGGEAGGRDALHHHLVIPLLHHCADSFKLRVLQQ
eukprot:CAMPEP_0198492136 /NCGR_PEP_ID=MMETSP1462-20131121/3260_1 /TAXON_ID=1333877 /ORGANISM="Brandtodinium nutriculum, Strain RCC3387" /LENGTH=104 /DNA_ID=CAMNT_0044220771 /DNA_START=122 /DNA_END=437 /DNA_ORIENTATION=-